MAHGTLASAAFGFLVLAANGPTVGQDIVERLMQNSPAQAGDPSHHAYSDFPDPLGRFMDSLAAGAFADAHALQPAACDTWRTNRQLTAISGRFHVWDTDIDLDTLCATH